MRIMEAFQIRLIRDFQSSPLPCDALLLRLLKEVGCTDSVKP